MDWKNIKKVHVKHIFLTLFDNKYDKEAMPSCLFFNYYFIVV